VFARTRENKSSAVNSSAAELPLLYTAGRWPTPPEVNYPAPADENEDKPRRKRQSELEAEPFLGSMPVYRYK
jgi:hypothetical protein